MTEWSLAIASAAWLGILTAISPCPLATNIAAISFVSRKLGRVGKVLGAGLLYSLGRTTAYTLLGFLLVKGLLAAPTLSHGLQRYMNMAMGPLLILVAMVLLNLLTLPSGFSAGGSRFIQNQSERLGIYGAFPLGVLFALSFCPGSAALFFGSLLPLSIRYRSGLLLPAVYGLSTGLPVLIFACLLAFGANHVGRAYQRLAQFEVWAQRVTGVVFLIIGIAMTLTVSLGLSFN